MDFWIDIENASGVAYGSGPITGATSWQWSPRLDGAGEFRFTLPAGDAKSTLLTNKRIAQCSAIVNGAVTSIGGGIIDRIETHVGDPTMLSVSGPDLMGELAYRSVGQLVVCEQDWVSLANASYGYYTQIGVSATGVSTDAHLDVANCHDGDTDTYSAAQMKSELDGYPEHAIWAYIGHDARFDRIKWTLWDDPSARIATAGGVLAAQYYNGSGWQTLTITDGTDDGSGTWRQSGEMVFTRPTDWTRYNEAYGLGGDWFWVRMRLERIWPANPSWTNYVDWAEVDVYADVPTTDGVNLIMAYAPDTWTKTGYPATVSKKYLEFNGESVLEALLTLAEQGGRSGTTAVREHFRLNTDGSRSIEWLGTTATSSGVRCVAPEDAIASEGKAELAILQSLIEQADTTEVVTRLYPRTADGITLASASDSAPDGYTVGTVSQGVYTHYYVQHTAAAAAYGQIERWLEFSELSLQQADSYATHPEMLANQLLERSCEYLRQRATESQHYQANIVQWAGLLKAGDTVDVVYHEWVDGSHVVSIDTVASGSPLWIISPTLLIDAQGLSTIGLEVSTIDRGAKSDAGVVVDLVRQNRRAGTGSGNYATIAVTGGGTPPAAGADIRVSGYKIQRAGSGILLFSGSGALLAEYATIATALAAATSGDIVEIPAGTLTENVTVPAGVTLRGRGWASIINGYVLGGVGAKLDNLKVYQSVNTSSDIIGVMGPDAAGTFYVRDVFVELIQAGSGKALGMLARGGAGAILEWQGGIRVRVSGGTGSRWAFAVDDGGAMFCNHGNVKATIG